MSAMRTRPMFSPLRQSLQSRAELPLDVGLCALDDLSFWNQDEIQPADLLDLVMAEALAQEPLRPVPRDGASDLPTHCQAEAPDAQSVLGHDEQKQRAVEPKALPKRPAEIPGTADALARRQAGLCRCVPFEVRQRSACALWPGDASGPAAHPWCACVPGSRASASAC